MTMPLTQDLICPDCGGVLGGTAGPGVKTCTCFAEKRPTRVGEILVPTEAVQAPADPAVKPQTKRGEKLCVACGKDLAGHRRLKDKRGYICLACAKEEKGTAAERGTCAECGRRVKKTSLTRWGTVRLCKQCMIEHDRDPRRHVRKIDGAVFKQTDWTKIYLAAAAAAVLLLIGLLHLAGVY